MMIVLITLLAIGLQNYVKLGVQSVLKTTADNLATGGEMDKTSVPSVNSIALKKGVKELGLHSLVVNPKIKVATDKSSTVKITPTGAKNKDSNEVTTVTGKWEAQYFIQNTDMFSSLERRKSAAPSSNSQQAQSAQSPAAAKK